MPTSAPNDNRTDRERAAPSRFRSLDDDERSDDELNDSDPPTNRLISRNRFDEARQRGVINPPEPPAEEETEAQENQPTQPDQPNQPSIGQQAENLLKDKAKEELLKTGQRALVQAGRKFIAQAALAAGGAELLPIIGAIIAGLAILIIIVLLVFAAMSFGSNDPASQGTTPVQAVDLVSSAEVDSLAISLKGGINTREQAVKVLALIKQIKEQFRTNSAITALLSDMEVAAQTIIDNPTDATIRAQQSRIIQQKIAEIQSQIPRTLGGQWSLPLSLANMKRLRIKRHHDGRSSATDLKVTSGNSVYAMTSGTVAAVNIENNHIPFGSNIKGNRCGTTIAIRSSNPPGIGQYLYCHLTPSSVRVKAGDRVVAGQLLALTGNTGRTSGPHLHIEHKSINHDTLVKVWKGLMTRGIETEPLFYDP